MKYNHFILLVIFTLTSFAITDSYIKSTDFKYNGAVLTHIHDIRSGYGSEISRIMHGHLMKVGYNAVQLNTFCYMNDIKEPVIFHGYDPSLTRRNLEEEINNLRKAGFIVMLKPHVWVGGSNFNPDNWRNKIDYSDDDLRRDWFDQYKKFIIDQAKIAERTGVSVFVIGTELVGMSKYDKYWNELIKEVRTVYRGKLTYAAEGFNAKNISFWPNLDYIGIDAYFQLTKKGNPELDEILEGWKVHKAELEKISEKYNKKIIFTEIGYKSVEGTTVRPWEWEKDKKMNNMQQAQAFEAFFRTFSDTDYLAGFFVWKYFTDNDSYERGNIERGFTPYNKIAEGVISSWISKGK